MDLAQVAAFLQSNRPVSPGKITLVRGQVFLGKVIKLFSENHALIQLGGLEVRAKLEAPLQAGKSYWLEVANSRGIPQLKVLEDGKSTTSHSRPSVPQLLESLGLSASKTREMIVRAFMNEGLLFSKETIVKGSEWLNNLEDKAAGLSVLKMMAAKELPMSRAIFEALLDTRTGIPTHERINQLAAALENTNERSDAILKLKKLLPELVVQPAPSGSETKRSLQQVVSRLGLSYEHDLAQSLRSSSHETLQTFLTQLAHESPVRDVRELSRQWLSLVSVEQPERRVELSKMPAVLLQELEKLGLPSDKLQQSNGSMSTAIHQDSLKSLLLQVLQQTQSNGTREQAQQMLSHITSQQLNATWANQVVIQLPQQAGDRISDVKVKWEGKKNKKGELDPDYCRILFDLDLAHLRQTAVDVHIQKRFVTVRVFNETHVLGDMIKRFEPLLKERLAAAGYQLSSIRQQQGKRPSFEQANELDSASGVDIRV